MLRISSLLRYGARPLLNQVEKKAFTNVVVRNLNRNSRIDRMFSSEVPKESATQSDSTSKDVMKFDSDEYDDYEPQTKQEKVFFLHHC